MKKLLSVFILSMLIISCFSLNVFCASAEESSDDTTMVEVRIEGPSSTLYHEVFEVEITEEQEFIYVYDIIKKIDDENADINIVHTGSGFEDGIDSINGIGEVDGEIDWAYWVFRSQIRKPLGSIYVSRIYRGRHVKVVIAYSKYFTWEYSDIIPPEQSRYSDGKLSFQYMTYHGIGEPRPDLTVELTSVKTGASETYVTDENGKIDLTETKLSGEVYVNYWDYDENGMPTALRAAKNEYTIMLPENNSDTGDRTVYGIVVVAAMTLGLLLKKRRMI